MRDIIAKRIIDFFRWTTYVTLAAMTLLTFADVSGRFLFQKPMLGSIELTELAMAILGGLAIFHTATQGGHIAVDLVLIRFPRRVQRIVGGFGLLLGAVTWGVIAYQVVLDGQSKIEVNRITDVFKISVGPFEFVLAFGFGLFALTLVVEFYRLVRGKKSESKSSL